MEKDMVFILLTSTFAFSTPFLLLPYSPAPFLSNCKSALWRSATALLGVSKELALFSYSRRSLGVEVRSLRYLSLLPLTRSSKELLLYLPSRCSLGVSCLHTCPGRFATTARNQATSGGGLGGRLFIPSRLRGSWAEGERILCQSTFRA